METQTDAVKSAEAFARAWLAKACPNFWKLLNKSACRALPAGLVAYLTTGDVERSHENLALAEADVAALVRACGAERVGHAFRRDLSGVSTEAQLAQQLCELAVAAALSRRACGIELRPRTGREKTQSDFAVTLDGVRLYGEVKRFEDTFPFMDDGEGFRVRSLVKTPPGAPIPQDAERPRRMDLVSKLEDVPRQFPEGTVNVLFVYNSGIADTQRHLQIALFGDAACFCEPDAVGEPQPDGLFARDAWRVVSACYLTRVAPEHALYFALRWPNPRALVRLPDAARSALDVLDFESARGRNSP
jgi:hypothetical protein